MKLLNKLEINVLKGRERKLEVEEGRKLAESVDKLRELKAAEEASIKLSHSGLVAALRDEIKRWTDYRDKIREEAEYWLGIRAKAQEPIDQRDAEFVRREKEIHGKEIAISDREKEVLDSEKYRLQKKEEAEMLLADAKEINSESKRLNSEAQESQKLAKALERQAANDKAKSDQRIQEAEEVWIAREAQVAVKEREISMRSDKVRREEEALELKKRDIINREAQLERTISKNKEK
jgi:hypothetical protein